jgi:mRNA interferase MazF
MPNLGEIWIGNLDPRRGTEPGNIRPVPIVQAQTLINADHPSPLVVPLTTNLVDNAEPLRIRIAAQSLLRRDSDLLIDQLTAIDNRFLLQGPLLQVERAMMERVAAALREVLDLD